MMTFRSLVRGVGLGWACLWVAQAVAQNPPAGSQAPKERFTPPLPPPGASLPRPAPTPKPAAIAGNPPAAGGPFREIANRPASAALTPINRTSSTNVSRPLTGAVTPAIQSAPTKLDPHALEFDATTKEAQVKAGETQAQFVFAFTNVSKAEVTLHRIQTSCGCTAARLPQEPWVVPAGGRGDISVVMDVRGKFGTVTKTATVFTSVGQFPLMVRSIIPQQTANEGARGGSERTRNLQIAAADRQAALRGECATCHVTPAIGKTGKALFDSACGVCHTAEHRASFVPDLARLDKPTDLGYWVGWITNGREGSLMPAFHQSNGGFLTDAQIESLASYMETEFKLEAALTPGPKTPNKAPSPLVTPAPAKALK